MDKMYKITLVISAVCICLCNGGQYTVIGGRKLRPFTDYTVGVSWTGPNSNSFLLELNGHHLPGGPYREAQQLIIEPATSKMATFKIGNLEAGNYTLALRSTSGELFSDSVQLQYVGKSFCTFLHTDKTVYQPGDTIYFRLLALNMYLKPIYNLAPQLTLKDGKGNVVRNWLNIPLTKGVFSGEFKLAEFPVLGDWSFEIELNSQIYMKKVFVADYVLPKFLINIEAPKHVYFNDKTFSVSVNSMQHTGQDVHGELIVSAYPVIYSGVIQPIFQDPLRKVMQISGAASTELNIKDELGLTEAEGSERLIVVEASIEESLTGRRHNTSTIVHLHRTRYSVMYDAPSFYKPNLPYTVQVKVSMWENEDLKNLNAAKVKYSFIGEGEKVDNKFVEGSCMFDNNGYCQYTFTPTPKSNQSIMDLEITYMDLKKEVKGIKSAQSPSESYVQIKLMNPNPNVNDKVKFMVNSTEPLNFYSYYVIGRGGVIYTKTAQIFPARRTDDFEFQATQAMAPEATIIVMLIKNDKEIVAASLRFKIEGLLQNNVRITSKPINLELLGNLDITVTASPNSYVALMAGAPSPDFSISTNHHYGSGEGSGLSMKKVLEEVRSFSNSDEINHPTKELDAYRTMEIFEKSGVFVMTNNRVNGQSFYVKPQQSDRVEGSTRPPLAGPYAFSHLPAQPAPRLHLGRLPTPTWLFTNVTLGGDGKGTLGRRVSEKAGMDWSIGAWAIHPTLGLGFAPVLKAHVRPKLFSIAAPEVARVRETIAITATLHNPYSRELNADITLHNANQEFKFEQVTNDQSVKPKSDPMQKQKLTIASNRSSSAVFFITPTVTPDLAGTTITIELSAVGGDISESVLHHLTLYPDGEETVDQISELLDLRNGPMNKNFILKEQKAYDSRRNLRKVQEEIKIGATGSLLSPALKVLPKLLGLPPASGYHNMLPFMASALLLHYLKQSDQSPDSIRSTGVDIMQKVYQQQMAYRQSDGSFSLSTFQKSKGSIWVTGMTAKWMGKAIRIVDVNIQRNIVTDALRWLSQQQSPDGSFRESSTVAMDDKVQQNQVVLTALTLDTFINTKFITGDQYSNTINKAQDWLARNVAKAQDERWDATILAPLAAVLHSAGHPTAEQATNLLNSLSNSTDGRRWWDLKTIDSEMKNPWRKMGSQNIWVSSWALKALLGQGFISEALETGKTLVSLLGDWSDLPEDLIALSALIDLSQTVSRETKAVVEFQCMNDRSVFSLNKKNSFILQKAQIRQKECKVDGEGYGVVLATMQALRRTNVTGPWPRFTLDPRVDAISTPHKLQLSICIGFASLPNEKESGPVLMKLRLPSGFVPDLDIPALQKGGFVRSARETQLAKMLGQPPLQIILSPLTAAERCLTLKASRLYPVANERPGVITLVDLTDNSRRARAFFSGGSASACELCGGAGNRRCGGAEVDCQGGCLIPAPLPTKCAVKEHSSAHALRLITLYFFLVVITIIIAIIIAICVRLCIRGTVKDSIFFYIPCLRSV